MRRFTITFPYRPEIVTATYKRERQKQPHEQVVQGCQFDNGYIGFAWQPPYEIPYGLETYAALNDAASICQRVLPFDVYRADKYRFEWIDQEG